jgi:copper chaperone
MEEPFMIRFKVETMTCGHCASAIRTALGKLAPQTSVDIDLERREVTVKGNLDTAAAMAALRAVGYDAVPVRAE